MYTTRLYSNDTAFWMKSKLIYCVNCPQPGMGGSARQIIRRSLR